MSFTCFTSSPTLGVTINSFFNFSYSGECVVVSHCSFNLHFPDAYWLEALFHTLLDIWRLTAKKSFTHFSYIRLSFFPPDLSEFFTFFKYEILCHIHIANTYSQSVPHLLSLLMATLMNTVDLNYNTIYQPYPSCLWSSAMKRDSCTIF